MLIPFIMAGAGMSLVFAPSASAVLSSVRVDQAGQASGTNNAILPFHTPRVADAALVAESELTVVEAGPVAGQPAAVELPLMVLAGDAG